MSYRALAILLFIFGAEFTASAERRIPVKVVVVTMFERGRRYGR